MINFGWQRTWGNCVFRCESVTSHPYCCSLGTHIDIKNKYIAFHILWFYIHIGDTRGSNFKTEEENEEFKKMFDEYMKELDAIHTKWQPKIDAFVKEKGVEPLHI